MNRISNKPRTFLQSHEIFWSVKPFSENEFKSNSSHFAALLQYLHLVVFQNHPQRYTWRKAFHGNLTLPKSTEKCWFEWDLIWDNGPPLYLLRLRCRVRRGCRRVFIQLKYTMYSRDKLTLSVRGYAVLQFYFTIILRDIHQQKFFMIIFSSG